MASILSSCSRRWCVGVHLYIYVHLELAIFLLCCADIRLFKLQSGPYDVTPPKKGEVKISQPDIDTLVVQHSGFVDPDSDIDHFELAIGSSPGGMNIVGWKDIDKDQTTTLTGMRGRIRDTAPIFASIKAYNGELLTTVGSSEIFYYDGSAPFVTDLRIARTLDRLWSIYSCAAYAPDGFCQQRMSVIVSNDSDKIDGRFFFAEPCLQSNISQMWFGIGTAPGAWPCLLLGTFRWRDL